MLLSEALSKQTNKEMAGKTLDGEEKSTFEVHIPLQLLISELRKSPTC